MTRLGGAFKYPQIRSNYMRRIASASTPQRDARRALLLVSIMLLASAAPILTLPGVSAHQSASDTIWPQEGSNDTGWVQLDAIGANGVTGAQASASWTLEFAPGAELSNVSFQVRVNGSDGLMIEEPMLVASDVGVNLLDWRGLGMLGSHDSFTGPNPTLDGSVRTAIRGQHGRYLQMQKSPNSSSKRSRRSTPLSHWHRLNLQSPQRRYIPKTAECISLLRNPS